MELFKNVDNEKYPAGSKKLNGNYFFLMPGGIDPHVHFNTPGYEDREDFEHGSLAAAAGGTTTIIDMPCTSVPPVVSKENFDFKLSKLKGRSYVDYALWGGVSPSYINGKKKHERDLRELAEAGVAGFKVYILSGMESFREMTYSELKKSAGIIKKLRKPIAVHAEDKRMVEYREQRAKRYKEYDWRSFCNAHDDQAELEAVIWVDQIARRIGTPIHIVHLSSDLALRQLKIAQRKGVALTAETCPHYLRFTEEDFRNVSIKNYLKTTPPVKKLRDKDALWEGLKDKSLNFVTSDHAGCNPRKEKSADNFWNVYSGIPGVEHRITYMLSEGFIQGRLSLESIIKLISENPAVYFNLKNKGFLKENYDADFVLVDLWKSEKIKSSGMHSKGKYTPFAGDKFYSVILKTFSRGNVVFDKNVDSTKFPKSGQFIPA
jgi:allantoinase